MPPPVCRAVSTREFLEELEIPDCGCPFEYIEERRCHCGAGPECERCPKVWRILSPACEHIEDADHDTSVIMWGRLWEAEDPEEYAEPPQAPPAKEDALTRQAKIEVYAERAALGLALFHPADLWRFRGDTDGGEALKATTVSEAERLNKKTRRRTRRRAMMRNGRVNPQQTLTTGEKRDAAENMLSLSDDEGRGAGRGGQHQQDDGK